MAMKEPIVIRPELADQFFAAMENGRVVLFTAPCGFGKSVTAQVLLAGRQVCVRSADAPDFAVGSTPGAPGTGGPAGTLYLDSGKSKQALRPALSRDGARLVNFVPVCRAGTDFQRAVAPAGSGTGRGTAGSLWRAGVGPDQEDRLQRWRRAENGQSPGLRGAAAI